VNALVVADVRYAVIEALRAEGGPERFVLANRNEQSLRDLIAAPCIAAFGFSYRQDAVFQEYILYGYPHISGGLGL